MLTITQECTNEPFSATVDRDVVSVFPDEERSDHVEKETCTEERSILTAEEDSPPLEALSRSKIKKLNHKQILRHNSEEIPERGLQGGFVEASLGRCFVKMPHFLIFPIEMQG